MSAPIVDNPLVTIAVTAFNAEDTIERAIASALAQSWRPVEILVVDDASTDGTVELVSSVARKHPEIKLIRHKENQGVGEARNTLIQAAVGQFVVFFDDDDVSVPHRVCTQIKRIIAYEHRFAPEGLVVCHSARRQTMPDGGKRIERAMGDRLALTEPAPSGKRVAERVLTGRPITGGLGASATCSQAARRSTYQHIGGFDPAFRRSEDTEFCIRAALAGGHFIGIAEPLVEQTMTLSSEKTLSAEYEAMMSVLDKHQSVFGTARAHSFARRWLWLKYQLLAGRRVSFAIGLAVLAIKAPLQTVRRFVYALPMSESRAGVRRLHLHASPAKDTK
jgi:GT2 family glycosyltransferase